MKRPKSAQQPNYIRKLHYLWRIGVIPREAGLHHVTVEHDDWCGIFEGTRCNCDPEITMKWSQPAAAQN
jgi:hypothetical protein